MSTSPIAENLEADAVPDSEYDTLVTEDHKPVDRIFLEKLYRLLAHTLYASWPGPGDGRPFLVLVNVGWFYQRKTAAVVPDCMVSLGVTCPEDLQVKRGHSYYQWDMGKSPDIIVEVVSDRTGGEEFFKKDLYARMEVPFYAIFDPKHLLSTEALKTYALIGKDYQPTDSGPWPQVGLGLRLWPGTFEGHDDLWLRWCDANAQIILTGEERARQERERAEEAAEHARQADERIRLLEAELQRLKGEGEKGGSGAVANPPSPEKSPDGPLD